jgi:hypothetical protein
MKKFVGRERKATEKEGKEDHPISLWWFGNMLVTEEDDRHRFWEKPLPFGFLQIRIIKR